MSGESFRFIHASDFHLESPLGDLDELPSHLADGLAEAPRRAAASVLAAGLAENIDFVVLSGDLLHPQAAGPRGMSMLLECLEQLHQQRTPVFWAAGIADDPAKWPEAVPLPPNVTLFPKHTAVAVPVERAGRTICRVVGRSSEGRAALHVPSYRMDPTDDFTVGVGYGQSGADTLAEARFDYWALGGQHQCEEIEGGATAAAWYCGSPQGRGLAEAGPHGYLVVDVDADRNTRTHRVDCDLFRYCTVKVDAAEIAAVGNLRQLLSQRVARLQHDNGGRHLLIGWEIVVANGEMLDTVGNTEELLPWLRREFGHGSPAAWTVSLNVRPPRNYPKPWYDEDTILGDFLSAAETCRQAEGRELNLLPLTEEQAALPASLCSVLAELPASRRSAVLDQATLLGVELLRGGKPSWVKTG